VTRVAAPVARSAKALAERKRALIVAAMLMMAAPAFAQSPGADGQPSVRALFEVARGQSASGDSAAALATLGRALAIAPNAEELLSAYARVSLAAGAPVRAVTTLRALTRMCASVADYHYLLGVALMQAGDTYLAVASLRRAEQLAPNRALTLTALGFAANSRKEFADARRALQRSLEIEPDNVETIAALAEAEEGLDELDVAEQQAARVLMRSPDHPTANLVRGLVLMKRTRYADARAPLEAATRSDTTAMRAHYQLSLLFARLGDDDNSRRHLERYQQALRDADERMKALRRETGATSGDPK
jgi:tetratricopeptide (TPR) repeat protein